MYDWFLRLSQDKISYALGTEKREVFHCHTIEPQPSSNRPIYSSVGLGHFTDEHNMKNFIE